MNKNKNSEENDDDLDEIEVIEDEYDVVESSDSIVESFDARRRLEKVLDDKALDRLINGNYYDDL